jgi:threonine aldolase
MSPLIDLSSDTATRPSEKMREAMAKAEVGDDQKGEDPTVNDLQRRVADLLGMEAALFLPTATMANQIAIKVQTQPGDEAIVERTAHIVTAEAGGPAVLSGIMLHTVHGHRGTFTPSQLVAGIRGDDPHFPRTRLVCVEQTANRGGGAVWPIELLRDIADTAHARGLAAHLDGSRLINAVIASGIAALEHTRGYDSVTFCLSKGLGCPVGALLAGSRPFVAEARRYKHLFGGAMRQAGIIAAAGLYALDHNIDRLTEDHANAKLLAEGLADIAFIDIDIGGVETNLVFFDVARTGFTGPEFVHHLKNRGVRMGCSGGTTVIRAVTHLDIARSDIDKTIDLVRQMILEPDESRSERERAVAHA